MSHPRVTIHALGALEREFLGALFTRVGTGDDAGNREWAIAGTMAAAARGIRARSVISLTDSGLLIELEDLHAE